MGPVGRNGEDGRRVAHWFPEKNHGDAGTSEPRRDVVDTRERGNEGSSEDTVGGYIHWPKSGDGVSVVGADSYLKIMRKGEELRGGGVQEGPMLATGGA